MNDICSVIQGELADCMFLGGMCLDVSLVDDGMCVARLYDGDGYAHSVATVSLSSDYKLVATELITKWALAKYLRKD